MNERLRHPVFNSAIRIAMQELKFRKHDGGRKPWCSSDDYEKTFALGYSDVVRVLKERVQRSEVVNILDLMSFGKALSKLPKTQGLAVGLIEAEDTLRFFQQHDRVISWEIPQPVESENSFFYEGDILRKSTWKAIDLWLAERKAKFDLIVCRAGGGINELPNCIEAHFVFLQRMYDRLENGGFLFTESRVEFGNYLAEFVRIARIAGVPADYQLKSGDTAKGPLLSVNDVLRVDKLATSPKQLPLINASRVKEV